MNSKVNRFSDPSLQTHDGAERIKWVEGYSDVTFAKISGKAVGLHDYYRKATADSSSLAGFVNIDSIGVTGGHPATMATGTLIPVNMAEDATQVFPTSNRDAAVTDVGKAYDIVVTSAGVQCINLAATAKGILTVSNILDNDGKFVAARIASGKRYGNI